MSTLLALVLIFDWVTVTEPVDTQEPLPPRTFLASRGPASWYQWRAGEAAAGPALRSLLGGDWRGQTVGVCANGECITVRLTDWCQCYRNEPRERVIDLDARSFAALAPLSAGLVNVVVITKEN